MSSLWNRVGLAPISDNQKVFDEIDGMLYWNTSYVTIKPVRLPNEDQDYDRERIIAITRNTKDGVKTMTDEELEEERKLDWEMLKKFTKKILSMDLTRFSFPVGYSEPRSFLERMADLCSFLACGYIERAYDCGVTEERLSLLATGIIAGFHIYMQSKKPWNPVLGETLVGQWPNGVQIFAEQISHHPPMSAFQLVSPTNHWTCYAVSEFTVSSGLMKVDVNQKGVFHLDFDDGTKYEWEFPMIRVLGIVKGDRIVRIEGPFEIRDVTNNLVCTVAINPKVDKKKGIVESKGSTLWGGILDPSGKDFVSTLRGDWCDKVVVDGEELWNLKTDFASRIDPDAPEEFLLPSDCRYRLDRAILIDGRLADADRAKVCIEEMQRREEKLRISVPLPQ